MSYTKFSRIIAFCFYTVLVSQQARAESECEQNYRTAPFANGASIHGVSVGLHGTNINTAAAALKKIGLSEGWELLSEQHVKNTTGKPLLMMVFRQKPTEKSREIFPVIQFAEKTDSAIIATALPSQMSAPTIKNYFCALMASAGLKGQAGSVNAEQGDQNFEYIVEWAALAQAHTASSAPPNQAGSLPMFDFRGLTAGQIVAQNHSAFLPPCADEGPGKSVCFFRDNTLAGIKSLSGITVHIYSGKFSKMEMQADNKRFTELNEALISRYGNPCQRETLKWQNQLGAVFDNPVITWCFRTGNLVLTGRTERFVDWMELRYQDNVVAPPAAKPKINF
jgi:hypothetical protein